LNPSAPCRFPLSLRIPRWCDSARIVVNGDALEMEASGGAFSNVTRVWQAGDQIKLHLPMPWRAIRGRKSQDGRVAVMRGPLLFCLNPQKQDDLNTQTMRLLRLDVSSLKLGESDKTIRPNGLTCQASFWEPGDYNAAGRAPLELTLTEYADPGCEWTYFLIPNPDAEDAVDDELAGCEIPL
jgi:uncharacterized protein